MNKIDVATRFPHTSLEEAWTRAQGEYVEITDVDGKTRRLNRKHVRRCRACGAQVFYEPPFCDRACEVRHRKEKRNK